MDVINHFRKDEHPFVRKVFDWITWVDQRHSPKQTDFLDPRQTHIVQTLVNGQRDVFVQFHGGFENAERVRAYLYPEYMEPDFDDFELSLIALEGNQAFHKLRHQDYLGSILGLGVKREKFGDILLRDDQCQLIAAKEVEEFILLHLHQVHRTSVIPSAIPFSRVLETKQLMKSIETTVASPRVDAVASRIFRISRSKIVSPIKNGHLKINWKMIDSPNAPLEEGDVVSLKGFGRFKVILLGEGVTRKGRLPVEIALYL